MDSILDTDNARVAFLNAHTFAKDCFLQALGNCRTSRNILRVTRVLSRVSVLGEKLKAAEMFIGASVSETLLWTQRTRCHDIYI